MAEDVFKMTDESQRCSRAPSLAKNERRCKLLEPVEGNNLLFFEMIRLLYVICFPSCLLARMVCSQQCWGAPLQARLSRFPSFKLAMPLAYTIEVGGWNSALALRAVRETRAPSHLSHFRGVMVCGWNPAWARMGQSSPCGWLQGNIAAI